MSEECINSVGRGDIFNSLFTMDAAQASATPVLAIPAAGSWNFGTAASGDARALELLSAFMPQLQRLSHMKIVFDCGGEGFVWSTAEHDYLTQRLGEMGLSTDRVFLLTSRIDPQYAYLEWCRRAVRAPVLTHLYSPVQLYYCAGIHRQSWTIEKMEALIKERSPFSSAGKSLRDKNYLCLNYSPREGRYAAALELLDKGLLGNGLVSFYGRAINNGHLDPPPALDTIANWLRVLKVEEQYIARLDELDAMCPITLDDPMADRMEKAYGVSDQDFYAKTYLSVVTESDFFGQAGPRFTEKVLKPMANLHPFVVVGTQFILRDLKRLGFQTFAPLIDESYDSIEDPARRLRAAMDEVCRLASMSRYELHAIYEQLWPRLLHNYLHFYVASSDLLDDDNGFKPLFSPTAS